MSTRISCWYALVGALFLGVLVFLPGSEANSIELLKYNHLNANEENQLEYIIQNHRDESLDYDLEFSVTSIDHQATVQGISGVQLISLDRYISQTIYFNFMVPTSGDYSFSLTATISNSTSEWTETSTSTLRFREVVASLNLQQFDRVDYDSNTGNGFWEWDGGLRISDSPEPFVAGAVIGPIALGHLREPWLELSSDASAGTGELRLGYSTDYLPEDRYSATWAPLLTVSSSSDNFIIALPETDEIYLRFYASCDDGCGWEIGQTSLSGVKRWHDLRASVPGYHFVPLDGGSSLDASLTNFGLLDEELGNISAHFLIYKNEVVVDEGLQSVALASGEQKSITFAPTLAEPGIYRAELRLETSTGVTSTLEFYIGHSAAAIADFESPDARNCAVLLKGNDEAVPALGVPFTLLDSHGIYHILEVETENLPVIVTSGAEIVAAVSLDTYGISIGSELAVVDTGDEWQVYTAELLDPAPMQIELAIGNSGFYSEEFMLEYHYSPLFLASVSGPSMALIAPGTVATIPVTITPHASIPQPGSSPVTVTVRLPGVGISESVTLLFDYREPVFEASEIRLDRHSLLAGQEIRGKLALLNDGFPANRLRAEIILLAPSGSESNIWSRNIEELGHGEEFSASFSHAPQQGGLYQLRLKVYQQDELLYSAIAEQDFRVVAGDGDATTEPPALELPRPALNMLALLSFLGLAFYTASSENSRYLGFKLLLPLYTRLRRDTLADEPTRQNLMRYIYVHPGANFTQLRDHFDLHNGTLSHHLNVLENHSVIESFRAGRQRLFYPCRAERTGVIARPLVTGEVQQQIVMLIKEEPGITQSMIATRLDMSRQKVNYHVTALTRQALIRVEPSGRITRLYPLHFT